MHWNLQTSTSIQIVQVFQPAGFDVRDQLKRYKPCLNKYPGTNIIESACWHYQEQQNLVFTLRASLDTDQQHSAWCLTIEYYLAASDWHTGPERCAKFLLNLKI